MKLNEISEQGKQKNISDAPGRKRFTKKKLYILLVITFILLTALFFYVVNVFHTPDLNELLIRARLTKLPTSIKNLQVDTRPYMEKDRAVPNQAELFVRFETEPNNIEKFINDSPGIKKNNFRPLRPLPESDHVPAWWPTDQTTSGRIYFIHDRRDINVMIAVYDDSNTIRICAWYIESPQLRNMQDNIEELRDVFEEFFEDMLHEVEDLFEDLLRD